MRTNTKNFTVGIFLDQAGKEKPLVVHFDEGDGVSDIPGDGVIGRNLDANRVFDQRIGQFLDLVIDRGRKKQGLPFAGKKADEVLDILDKTQVEHVIGLVEHQHLHPVEVNMALAHEVEHPAGCGDENIDAFFQPGNLRILLHAAEHAEGFHPGVFADGVEHFRDLQGEFAGGLHHHAFNALRAAGSLLLVQHVHNRDRKGRCLAGAGLRNGQHILPVQDGRDGFELDIGRAPETQGRQVPLDFRLNAIIVEFHILY